MNHDFSVRWPQLSYLASIKYPRICETVMATDCPALVELHGRLFKITKPREYVCTCKQDTKTICTGCLRTFKCPPLLRDVEVYGPSAIRINQEARQQIADQ